MGSALRERGSPSIGSRFALALLLACVAGRAGALDVLPPNTAQVAPENQR